MSQTPNPEKRLLPTVRPAERLAGYQRWRDVLFVHWPVPVEALRPLVPEDLSLDTFNGTAWVGLVPFHMTGVRPAWSPPAPGVSTFHETNVRTYVHLDGREPGVWFFSLDAASSLAVRIARFWWYLPYFRSRMRVQRIGSRIAYEGRRLWPRPAGAGYRIEAEVGEPLGTARPQGTLSDAAGLEFFLIERYLLYARARDGSLWRGQVHHPPYPLRAARLRYFEETMRAAAGIAPPGDPAHVLFSEGVDVEIFRLRPVA